LSLLLCLLVCLLDGLLVIALSFSFGLAKDASKRHSFVITKYNNMVHKNTKTGCATFGHEYSFFLLSISGSTWSWRNATKNND